MKTTPDKNLINNLPDSPGVYLFYGASGELLYVGKSKAIRTRVRSHFTSRNEAWLRRRVRHVEARSTAGELGALLLESQLIKELRPMFNVASRKRRRIIIARRTMNSAGYAMVALQAVDYLDIQETKPILGIFKHKTQAKEFLTAIAKTYRLCPKLLRLETSKRYCFSYHLGQCRGACMGEEDPALYNARVEKAFLARTIKAWPYDGGIVVEERSADNRCREFFLIDNWCLVSSFKSSAGAFERHIRGNHRFDYESYKILLAYLTDEHNHHTVMHLDKQTFERVCQNGPKNLRSFRHPE